MCDNVHDCRRKLSISVFQSDGFPPGFNRSEGEHAVLSSSVTGLLVTKCLVLFTHCRYRRLWTITQFVGGRPEGRKEKTQYAMKAPCRLCTPLNTSIRLTDLARGKEKEKVGSPMRFFLVRASRYHYNKPVFIPRGTVAKNFCPTTLQVPNASRVAIRKHFPRSPQLPLIGTGKRWTALLPVSRPIHK